MKLDLGEFDPENVSISLRGDGTISLSAQREGRTVSFRQIRQLAIHHEPDASMLAPPRVSIEFTTEQPEGDPWS